VPHHRTDQPCSNCSLSTAHPLVIGHALAPVDAKSISFRPAIIMHQQTVFVPPVQAHNYTVSVPRYASAFVSQTQIPRSVVKAGKDMHSSRLDNRHATAMDGYPVQVPYAISAVPKPDMILCIGDSLTAGIKNQSESAYPQQLEALLHSMGFKQFRVDNAGNWGDTSSNVLGRLPKALQMCLSHGRLSFVLILAGTNDFLQVAAPHAEHQVPAVLQRLQQIQDIAAKAAFMPHVGVLTLPPLPARNAARLRLNQELRNMDASTPSTISVRGRRFLVDLESVDPALSHDGVHFNSTGNADFARRVLAGMKPLLDVVADSMHQV